MIISDLSIVTGLVGYDETYSLSEFKEYLKVDLPSKKYKNGWVFWRPERRQQLQYELPADEGAGNVTAFDLLIPSEFCGTETKDTIKRLLETMTSSDEISETYLVQFWAPERVDRHLYLTSTDQAFAVGSLLYRGLCWYRHHCMGHRYRADEDAAKEELGAVGRAYRTTHPESTPDLRLYSTKEFPLRDVAARCGLREYFALPVFDLGKKECYGVIEVLSFDEVIIDRLRPALEVSQLRTTHLNFRFENFTVRRSSDSRDIYLVEFFLQFNSGKDAFADESSLPLLLRIMETELKHFKFGERGEHGEELVVEVCKENMLSSGESSQEYIEYKLKLPREISMLMDMQGCKKICPLPGFRKCLQKADLHFQRPSERRTHGWTFWSGASEELPESSNEIHEKIKCLMSEITFKSDKGSYALAQFWAPKKDMDRLYLETSGQPFAVGYLHKGLAFFRKQCMENYYFVDERAKEEELGPLGRVFLNKHPEITPDLRLYSPTEFPLRNHAAHYGLREYFALPVFNSDQHECVGVLELVAYKDWTLEVIQDALLAAKLSSTHIYFNPRFQDAKCKRLALTEIQEAGELFDEIPQLYRVEVWVPYSKCPSTDNNFCCMERVWAMPNYELLDHPMYQIQHVKNRKGIAGMALASENKSCFCRNLCGFSIAEQPLAHHAQHASLDVCFAICLQSWNTGDLLYVLEFYLNQGPGQLEYLRSFLCLLLPIMKQKLRSFQVASGEQLGEKLVVEVIEFSEVNEIAFSELDQPDISPIKFKFVKYCSQKHSKDIQAQFARDSVESIRSVAQTEHCNTSATNLKKKDAAEKSKGKTCQNDSEDKQVHFPSDVDMDSRQENASIQTNRGKRTSRLNINRQDLEPHFGQKLKDAAKQLGVSRSTIKRKCRENDIQRWPSNENHKKNPSIFMGESAKETAQDSEQNMRRPSCFSNLPPSDMPPHQNVLHTNPECSQGLIVQPKDDMVVIEAKYEEEIVKFQLYNSAGMEKLTQEVAMGLKLKMESFKLKYFDEDNDEILLTCDADLQLCLKSLAAVGKTCIQVCVRLI